jgi:hypothetical protein
MMQTRTGRTQSNSRSVSSLQPRSNLWEIKPEKAEPMIIIKDSFEWREDKISVGKQEKGIAPEETEDTEGMRLLCEDGESPGIEIP